MQSPQKSMDGVAKAAMTWSPPIFDPGFYAGFWNMHVVDNLPHFVSPRGISKEISGMENCEK
jgi:hypothetical protein